MTGYSAIRMLREVEELVDDMGLRLTRSRYSNSQEDRIDVAVKLHFTHPVYIDDAVIFTGSLEEIRTWLAGVAWARNYDALIGLSTSRTRYDHEQQCLHDKTVSALQTAPGVSP